MTDRIPLDLDNIGDAMRMHIEKAAAAGARAIEACRAAGDSYVQGDAILEKGGRFNVLSLRDWLAVSHEAGVEALPAVPLGDMSVEFPFKVLDNVEPTPEDLADFDGIVGALNAVAGAFILRWDHCSGMAVKMSVNGGEGLANPDYRGFVRNEKSGKLFPEMDDPRAVDLLADYPGRRMPMFARPLVEPRMISGADGAYPSEWRVFVTGSKIAGISNYYPQAPRALDDEVRASVAQAIDKAQKLLDTLASTGAIPHHPTYDAIGLDPEHAHCTLDFIETVDGRMLLVEGGPAHSPRWGAHMCCFAPGEVAGVALAEGETHSFEALGIKAAA